MKIARFSDDEIIRAYKQTSNVWKAAELLGVSGQTISRRLKNAGHAVNKRYLTDDDRAAIRAYYEAADSGFDLSAIAQAMGRTRAMICRAAGEMGLTDLKRPASAAEIEKAKRPRWQDKPHPKGATGMKHTDETKKIISETSTKYWSTAKAFGIGLMSPESLQAKSDRQTKLMASKSGVPAHSRARGGRRDDLGDTWFRSSWEANYARYLNLLIKLGVVVSWAYEPETFWFEAIRRGVRSYRPDFKVMYKNDPTPVYVEIKGWMDDKSKTKLKRMKKYHPHIKIELVASKEYTSLKNKWKGAIPTWE